ncbi:MAG: NAD(P)H-dependent oxidoreductase [Candidatus Sumerlaeaceae bacterium]|nr:NAD(P)H-dependent oxidoreductase [Candidatus Sumerlaeaceae bacterium]
MPKVLGISGSLREGSHTRRMVELALQAAAECGSATELLDLREHPMPLFEAHRDYKDDTRIQAVVQKIREAECYIVGTPEYHGCMSGALKNLFDFVYTEISGKLFGIVAATGGSQGVSSLDNLRACLLYCHAWVLPYNVGASSRDFDDLGNIVNDQVVDRLRRVGRDVAVYGPLLWEQFRRDLVQPDGAPQGFAGWVQ